MADFKTVQSNFSPDNRLSFEQAVAMAARIQDTQQVSSLRALKIVEDTQHARQAILDERAKASGSKPWAELRSLPNADQTYQSPVQSAGIDVDVKKGRAVISYVPPRRVA